jgi:hypothetical protein
VVNTAQGAAQKIIHGAKDLANKAEQRGNELAGKASEKLKKH